MDIKITPTKLKGEILAITSKSDAHRAMIAAALADEETLVLINEYSNDIKATADCIKELGAEVTKTHDGLVISPLKKKKVNPKLNCKESGSTLRFLLPTAIAVSEAPEFFGEGRLPERPMDTITHLLKEKGILFSGEKLPFSARGDLKPGIYPIEGNVSSQFISGLLFALPLLEGDSEIELLSELQSRAYVEMTINTLEKFGVKIVKTEKGFFVPGNQKYKSPKVYKTEGDWSNSAFWLVCGAFGEEISVFGNSLKSLQSDKRILDILEKAGACVTKEENKITVKKSKISPFSLDVSQCPDLFPIAAILACGAEGKSRLYNASRLRLKESDRIETVRLLINALGGKAECDEDSLTVFGTGELLGGSADSGGDHRITMSAFAASLICSGAVNISGAEAMNKSYPDFMRDFNKLGGNANVI